MEQPAISVVVPLYNNEEYVGECLESILNQTFQDFEVIVVDDCSTDNSVAIVESYAPKFDGRLRLAQTEENSGGGGYVPRNIGLKLASGEYVIFVDSDDFILLTALETLYQAAKQYDADVVYAGTHYDLIAPNKIHLHQDGERIRLLREGFEDNTILRVDDQKENLSKLLLEEREGNFRAPWSKLIRRELLIENKIFFPVQMVTGGDFIWVINVYCHAKRFLRISTPFYFYRSNTASVTKKKKEPLEQIAYWSSAFVDFVKNLSKLEKENKILSENIAYCFAAFKWHFGWILKCTSYSREKLSSQEIYEALHQKLPKDSSTTNAAERKIIEDSLNAIDKLKKKIAQLKNLPTPAISIVIPVYNAEQYVSECLDSLLMQTFQDFEVIVVDDCSTDNSVKIVESYSPKFSGRLQLYRMEENSGGGGNVPRNIGLTLASGEYIFFLDADDFILLTALETLNNFAKEYDADVVYTGSYYDLKTPNNIYLHIDKESKHLLENGLEDKPDLRVNNPNENLQRFLTEEPESNFTNPWTKFIRRDFLLKNRIFFPNLTNAGDFIWVINVYCHAKRFLRISTPFYFYRQNTASVTLIRREPFEQVVHWASGFVDWMKFLGELENENEILSDNLIYCFRALKKNFNWRLWRTHDSRNKLSNQDVYAALNRKFTNDSYDLTVPFFFSFIDNERKVNETGSKTIKQLEKEISQLKNSHSGSAISVIIPMYNAEKYIGKCLDSLLEQTFQNFEVIVVDDCSTDKSFAVVASYAPKFNGRLILSKTKENTGNAAFPRNKGLTLSCGEYIQFVDADDMLIKTALEELYKLAQKWDAEVVCCEKFYETDANGTNRRTNTYQKGKFVEKPTLEPNDLKERVKRITEGRYLTVPWNKLVRRDLIMKNEIFFPSLKTSEDNIYTQGLVFYAKKFLRVPNIVYIYRQSEGSSQRAERTPQQKINFWLNPVLFGLKSLNAMMDNHEFFKKNPSYRIEILKNFITARFDWTLKSSKRLTEEAIYSAIKDEFGGKLGEYDVLISALCTILYDEKNARKDYEQIIDTFSSYLPARLKIKFNNKKGLQILDVSDSQAKIENPNWFQKDGIGYVIQFYAEKFEFVSKATDRGQIQLRLEGISVYDPDDKSKRIPCWVDYTRLVINGETLIDTVTPVWHDKPYVYTKDVKAGEYIRIQVEWLPHQSKTETKDT